MKHASTGKVHLSTAHITASGLTDMCNSQLSVCYSTLVPGILQGQLGIVTIGPDYIQLNLLAG